MASNIGCIGLIAIAGFIGFLFYRRKRIASDLQDFYKQGNYIRREQCPVQYPFMYTDLSFVVCSDGFIKENMPYTLMLGTRYTGGGQIRRQDDFIGFYFPPLVQLGDEWLNRWKQKVVERGDGWAVHSGMEQVKKSWGLKGIPDSLPIRAVCVENGVLLAWSGLHLRKNIEARIHDVLASLRAN